jgi:hypothetical protein
MLYVTECNGRKSLHIHALSYGALLPEFVARVAHDPRCEVRSLERDEQPSGTCRVTDARGPGREAEVVGELRST